MMPIDHAALAPAYCAAGTAVLAFLIDLLLPGRRAAVLAATTLGAAATGVASWWAYQGGPRRTFCVVDTFPCSYVWGQFASLVGVTVGSRVRRSGAGRLRWCARVPRRMGPAV